MFLTSQTISRERNGLRERVISNFNANDRRVEEIMVFLYDIQTEHDFIEPQSNLVVIYRDAEGLGKIAERIKQELKRQNLDIDVNDRMKDSQLEKMARWHAMKGRLHKYNDSRVLDAKDQYGVELVGKNEEAAYLINEAVKKMPFLKQYVEEHYNELGLTHQHMIWNNGIPSIQGIDVAIQVTDRKNHELNKKSRDARGHDNYKKSMMQQPHSMPEKTQVIVIDNRMTGHKIICPGVETERARVLKAEDKPTGIMYHLINPREYPVK
ncbi:hypothetical protein KY339_02385 [Candidatus Woesearchaeota archaeon]|nr:hypothetical protein [Candidatus Woesearchaeota archaeon]